MNKAVSMKLLETDIEAVKKYTDEIVGELSDRTSTAENRINTLAAAVGGLHADSWNVVLDIVDTGLGAAAFPVGTQFVTPNSDLGDITWEVADHQDVEDAGGNVVHGMQLLMYYIHKAAIRWDAAEMLTYFEDGLPAGTYYFTIPTAYNVEYNDLITDEDTDTMPVQFTTTKDIPAGGGIRLNWGSANLSDGFVYTYPDNATDYADDNELTEKCAVSRGTDGTFLGAADDSYINDNFNALDRSRYGSNNYKESAVRQYLNASEEANTYWQQQTPFDRIADYTRTMPGFMRGFEDDFLAAVCPVKVITSTNNYTEVSDEIKSSYTTTDKFYLPSRTEIAGGTQNGIAEGKQFALTKGYSNSDFVKRIKSGSPQRWWFRTPDASTACTVRVCNASGNTSTTQTNNANGSYYFAACCTIAKSKA